MTALRPEKWHIKVTLKRGDELPDCHRPDHDRLESAQDEVTKLRQWEGGSGAVRDMVIQDHSGSTAARRLPPVTAAGPVTDRERAMPLACRPRRGSAISEMGKDKPHAAAINIAQENTRLDHPMMTMQLPEPSEWSHQAPEASTTLQHMLRRNGYPEDKAAGAWVAQRKHTDTASATGYDPDERTVGVGLHPTRWDYGTLAHEA